tara:strand:- start:98 stop:199 length:102 start_codon:yes stop_codon:yes gene_type:complete
MIEDIIGLKTHDGAMETFIYTRSWAGHTRPSSS